MQTYTKREMAYKLKVSPRTVSEDAKFLNLKPTVGDRGLKLYSQSDFNLISQMREHCADKSNSRESFLPSTVPEIVEPEPKVRRLSVAPPIKNFSLDPLYDLDLLQRIADNNYLLPTNRIAPIIGLSSNYLLRQSSYFYCGFLIQRQAKKNNQIYWNVYSQ